MEKDNLVSITEFCNFHQLDIHFIDLLEESGLIQTTVMEHQVYIESGRLESLEKLVRMHRDLEIHADNLDIVAYLVDRMQTLQLEIVQLKNRLKFYEHFL